MTWACSWCLYFRYKVRRDPLAKWWSWRPKTPSIAPPRTRNEMRRRKLAKKTKRILKKNFIFPRPGLSNRFCVFCRDSPSSFFFFHNADQIKDEPHFFLGKKNGFLTFLLIFQNADTGRPAEQPIDFVHRHTTRQNRNQISRIPGARHHSKQRNRRQKRYLVPYLVPKAFLWMNFASYLNKPFLLAS